MGKRHFGHSHHNAHSHHSHHGHHSHHKHDPFWDHQHEALKLFVFGTRGKDGLAGTEKSEIIVGFRGNDEILGKGGNDWIDGGRGSDTLDGGAGSDKIFGGRGDDTVIHSLADNSTADGCRKGDFYDGGKGHDVLRLVLTADEMADDEINADIAAFKAFLAENANECGGHGKVFKFESFDLAVRGFEEIVIDGEVAPPSTQPNTPPMASADPDTGLIETLEDTSIDINVLANDSDPDGDPLHVAVVIQPTHGIVEFNPDGTLKYTPEEDYFGLDSFSYQASDGKDLSQAVGVDIEVLPVNDAPQLKDDNDLLVLEFNARSGVQFIDIPSILSHYNAGADNEIGQTVSLKDAMLQPGFNFGNLFGINTDTQKIVYMPPTGVPPRGHDIIDFHVVDSLGAVSEIQHLQIDIVDIL